MPASLTSLSPTRPTNRLESVPAARLLPPASEQQAGSEDGQQTSRRVLCQLGLILLLALVLRVPGLTRPMVGHFATRACVYGMVARNWVEGRAGFFEPSLDLVIGGERSLILLELPLPAYFTGLLWHTLGGSLDVWGRVTAIAWSLAGIGLMYALLARRYGTRAGLCGALTLALSPVGIIFGQTFQLEVALVPLTLAAMLCLDSWLTDGRRWLSGFALAGFVLAAGLLFLTKIFMLTVLAPLAWLAVTHRTQLTHARWVQLAAATLLALTPTVAWYGYVYFGAQGHFGLPVERLYYSVHESATVHAFPHPVLRQPTFYRHLFDDVAGIVLTPVGLGLMLLALLRQTILDRSCRAPRGLMWVWLAAVGITVLVLPRKFHEMTYYWVGMLPVFAALAGLGLSALLDRVEFSRWGKTLGLAAWVLLAARYAATPAFATPPEDRAVTTAGLAVQQLCPPEARVVTLHGSSLDLLYYCDRPGFILGAGQARRGASELRADGSPDELRAELARYREQGATHLVIVDLRQLERIAGLAEVVDPLHVADAGDDFRVYDLTTLR